MSAPELTDLLAEEASRFTLQAPPDPAEPAGIIELEALRERKPLGVGIYVKHLPTGQEAMVRPDVAFESQSVIKVALLIRAYQLAENDEWDLDERIRLSRSDLVGGAGILRYFQEGLNPTWRDLLMAMVVTSDNSATDLVLARIGGTEGLNGWLVASGYPRARMATSVLGAARFSYELADVRHKSLTAAQVYALRRTDPAWAGMTRDWLESINGQVASLATRPLGEVRALARQRSLPLYFGRMTPREAGRMLESIERATAVSERGSAEMTTTLRRQQLGQRRLPQFLDCPVGHKTGDFPPWDANDVGIVYAPSGPVVVAVFANDLAGRYEEEEDRIGRIARVSVDHFERA